MLQICTYIYNRIHHVLFFWKKNAKDEVNFLIFRHFFLIAGFNGGKPQMSIVLCRHDRAHINIFG